MFGHFLPFRACEVWAWFGTRAVGSVFWFGIGSEFWFRIGEVRAGVEDGIVKVGLELMMKFGLWLELEKVKFVLELVLNAT